MGAYFYCSEKYDYLEHHADVSLVQFQQWILLPQMLKMMEMLFHLMLLVQKDCVELSLAFAAFDINVDYGNPTMMQLEVLDEVNKNFVSLLQLR